MADKDIMAEEEATIVEFSDEEGNVFYYEEELIIPVGDTKFALLVGIPSEDEEHEKGCTCGCEDDEDVMFAKIVLNDAGEEEYVEPTDEEFEAVTEAYNKLMDEEGL